MHLKEKSEITLTVHDPAGRLVKKIVSKTAFRPGRHTFSWNGSDRMNRPVSSGLYIIRLAEKDRVIIRKGFLLK
jgi:flagellar hook assembly protein FlgD